MANRSHTSQITWRIQQYWCVHRPASKEVRHLKEKSSRGFRFLRHRHKHKVLLQYQDPPQKQKSVGSPQLTHPPKTEPCAISEPRNQTIVTNKLWYQCQWRNARNRMLFSEKIHLRNKIWWISTATKAVSNQTTIWHHQPLTLVKWFEPLQAHHSTSLTSEHSHWREIQFRNKTWWTSTTGIHSRRTRTKPNNQWVWWNTRTLIHQQKSWQHPKIVPLPVAPMLLQHKRLTVSNMLLQKRDPPQNSNGSQPLNASVKAWQQHQNGSIWCTSNKQNTAQHRDPLQTSWMELNRNSCQHPSITWRKNLQHRKV